MIHLQDKQDTPNLEEIGEYIRNPVFGKFCREIKAQYGCSEKIEYSSCSLEKGWNVKFRKAGKTLCTIYPRENYFTVMIVVGEKEKMPVEAVLLELSPYLRGIYAQTKEGNGQKWLMIDLEDEGDVYRDAMRLIQIRRGSTGVLRK